MAQIVQGKEGIQAIAAGGNPEVRTDHSGATVVSPLFGFENARKSQTFTASTAVGGVAPGTSVGTAAGFALQNPDAGSTWLVLRRIRMAYLSGTLGAGAIALVSHVAGADFTGTAITPISSRLGSGTAAGLAFTAATVPASGTVVRYLGSIQASLASTAVGGWLFDCDLTNDPIIIAAALGVSIQGITAAGSTPLVLYSVTFDEVAVP